MSRSYSWRARFGLLVDDDAADALAARARRHPALGLVDVKALVAGDVGDRGGDGVRRAPQQRPAREHEVVGIAGVGRAEARGERGQAAVEAERAQVRQRGRGRCALRQVRRREPPSQPVMRRDPPWLGRPRDRLPHRGRHGVRAQPGDDVGDALGVAGGAQDAVDAPGPHRGEAVLEVEGEHDRPAAVQRRMRTRRAPADESVRGIVDRDPHQQVVEQAPLDRLQPRLRALDHARAPVAARDGRVAVAAQALVGDDAFERADVSEPGEPLGRQAEPGGELAGRLEHRDGPGHAAHRRMHRGDAHDPHVGTAAAGGERQGHEARELARPVGRRARVAREHVAGDAPQPPRPRREHGRRAAHERVLGPDAGEIRGGEGGGDVGAACHRWGGDAGPTRSASCVRRPAAKLAAKRMRCRAEVLPCPRGSPGGTGAPVGARRRLGPASPRERRYFGRVTAVDVPHHSARLLVSCADRPGIVAAVSGFLFERGREHRVLRPVLHGPRRAARSSCAWSSMLDGLEARRAELDATLRERGRRALRDGLADRLRATREALAILVSRYDHCLLDLLWRWRRGELRAEIALVDLQPPRPRAPTSRARRALPPRAGRPGTASRRPRRGCSSCCAATSTSWCSPATCRSSPATSSTALGAPVINIHHSFLPAFAGAEPVRARPRARREADRRHGALRDRGARRRPDHRAGRHARRPPPGRRASWSASARDIERIVLARAVAAHLDDRVIVDGARTIVF